MAEQGRRTAVPPDAPSTGTGAPLGREVASPARPPARRPRPWLGLGVLAVVLVAALVVGSGVGQGGHRTAAQRAAALDADLRCPSCEDLSVAQSSASSAVAVRHEVLLMARQGRTDQQIEDALVGQYGSAILLRPPTSGLASLVWIVPALAGLAAAAALGVLFWRRARQMDRLRRGPG